MKMCFVCDVLVFSFIEVSRKLLFIGVVSGHISMKKIKGKL